MWNALHDTHQEIYTLHIVALISEHVKINKMLNGGSGFRGHSFEMRAMTTTLYRLILPGQFN